MMEWLSRDGKLLLATRCVRAFGYGFLSVILALYLFLIGFSSVMVGVVLSATLLGGAGLTILASLWADRFGRRKMLLILAAMMALSGIIYAVTDDAIVLILAAAIGTLSPTGGEIGSFLPIEQAILPQTCPQEKRNAAFSIYNTIGTLSAAAGALFSGLGSVFHHQLGIDEIQSYHLMFLIYSLLAITAAALYLMMSARVELDQREMGSAKKRLTHESRRRIAKLSMLFGVDSFGGGFVLQSIISYWFFVRFNAPLDLLSVIFFTAGILTSVSIFFAGRLADRIGLINTMVLTHLPSSIFLMLIPLMPSFELALAFYLARQSISQMDVPTRQSYTVAVVRPEERTIAAGTTSIARNMAQATSPSLSGYAMAISLSSPFLIGGSLKIAYDLALYYNFRRIRADGEKPISGVQKPD